MNEYIDTSIIVQQIKDELKYKIENLSNIDITAHLALIQIGNDAGSMSYQKSLHKLCTNLNINVSDYNYTDISTEELLVLIHQLNEDTNVNGIMLFMPLPESVDIDLIKSQISNEKDVDCLTRENFGNVFFNHFNNIMPCTAKATFLIIKSLFSDLASKKICIVNNSNVIGLPLAIMSAKQLASVSICNHTTPNLIDYTSTSDIVICATGQAKMFNQKYFKEDSIVIDVGVSLDVNKRLSGDVDYDSLKDSSIKIANNNEVGQITSLILISHLIDYTKRQVEN